MKLFQVFQELLSLIKTQNEETNLFTKRLVNENV